jgi:cytochrome P450
MKYDDVVKTPDFIRDPFPYYARLRREEAVHWSEHWGAWLLTRYDDIKQCLLDTETFSSRGRAISHFGTLYSPEQLEQLQPLRQQFLEGLISSDPPDHTRLKRFMLKGIRPMNDASLKDVVHALVEELLVKVRFKGRMEAVADFAYPLPIYVTLAILGVRQSDRDRLKAACELFLQLSTDPRPTFAKALESQRGLLEIKEQFASLLEERRRHPGHDFISNLAAGEKEGVLSESEILTTLVTVLIGGHETTTYLLASSLWVLKQYPEQLEALKRNPALLPAATEEFIRYVGPFQYVRRVATRQIDFRGKKINAGDLVMLHLAAGNRDPAVFSAPEKLDITRSPNRHLGFGHGPHACLGAPFARSEVPIALESFFRHIPDYQIDAAEIAFPNHSLRGPKSLPLKF